VVALNAVLFCKEVGFLQVIFEGDASQVISDINSPHPHFSKAGHLTKSVIRELESFRKAIFVYVPRELNEVAHTLAKEAVVRKIDDCSDLYFNEAEFYQKKKKKLSSLIVSKPSLVKVFKVSFFFFFFFFFFFLFYF
jgi:hypothetical protein